MEGLEGRTAEHVTYFYQVLVSGGMALDEVHLVSGGKGGIYQSQGKDELDGNQCPNDALSALSRILDAELVERLTGEAMADVDAGDDGQ